MTGQPEDKPGTENPTISSCYCVHEIFEKQVEDRPDGVALVHGQRHVSYRELNRLANGVARELLQRDLPANSAVAICLDRSPEAIAGMLGILKAGAAYLALDPSYPCERLQFLMEDSGASVLLTRPALLSRFPHWSGPVLDADEIGGCEENPPRPSCTGESLAYLMYTSGSTGTPKGVEIPHRGIVRLVFENDYARFGDDTVFLQMAPTSFDASTFEIWGALLHGGRCVLYPGDAPSATELGAVLRGEGVTTLWLTSSLFNALIDDDPGVLSTVKQLLVGGEALSVRHIGRALEVLPETEIINGYGPTESTTFTCCYRIPRGRDLGASIPIGRPIARTEVYIVDEQLKPVAAGDAGEIYIGGEGLALGYRNRPELTNAVFVSNPFVPRPALIYKTGDVGRYLPDGNIEFLGRKDTQVKLRGFRIELGEIEAALARRPGVEQAVVAVYEPQTGDKRLAAYVVMPGRDSGSEAELREYLLNSLPAYMVPSALVFLERLPLTRNGKVDRQGLPLPGVADRREGVSLSPGEEVVAAAFRKILNLPHVGCDDNFFECGGHSLMAMRLTAMLGRDLGIEISLREFYAGPTVSAVSQLGETRKSGVAKAAMAAHNAAEISPMSFSQEGLWFLEQLDPGRPAYHIARCFEIRGALNVAALERALHAVRERHEALRTSFHLVDGTPSQKIEPARGAELRVVKAAGPEAVDELVRGETVRPFDLSEGALLRALLIQCAPDRQYLSLVIHHIATDAWSMTVLLKELSLVYTAYSGDSTPQLAPLPLQYRDYAEWQRKSLAGPVLERHLDYWKRSLDGVPALQLRSGAPRPGTRRETGSRERCVIPAALVAQLEKLSREAGCTLFTALLSGFETLLGIYSGQVDFAIGCPVANRPTEDTDSLVGFFVNNIMLRAKLSGEPGFRELLTRNRDVTLDAFSHQAAPFEKVVESLRLPRDLKTTPLLQAMLAFANVPTAALMLPGLDVTEDEIETGTAKFDLTLSLAPGENGEVTGYIEYRDDVFTCEEARRFCRHLVRLLEGAAAAPDAPVLSLPVLDAEELDEVIERWNATQTDVAAACVYQQIDERAAFHPDAIAVMCGGGQTTYGEVRSFSDQVAGYLRRQGIGKGDVVAVVAERSARLPAILLGVWKAGAAYLPLDPTYPGERLSFMLEDSAARAIIHPGAESLSAITSLPVITGGEIEASGSSGGFPPVCATPESMAYLMYTSGSTGRPKGVEVLQGAVSNVLEWVIGDMALNGNDTILGVATPCFDISLFDLFVPLICGARLVLATSEEAHDGSLIASLLERHGATVLQGTPATWMMLLESGWKGKANLKTISTGEALPRPLATAVAPLVRTLWNYYGPTETTIWSTGCRVTAGEGPVPIGRPLANTRTYILNECGQPVPIGRAGELYIGGAGVAAGYRNRPELTAERFVSDPFVASGGARMYRTGDLARYQEEGTIELVGRRDNQVKLRGYRIELGEIEAAVRAHEGVHDCAVLLREDVPGEKTLVAYIARRSGAACDAGTLRQSLRSTLPGPMVPAMFEFLPSLPRTTNGKTDRAALPMPTKNSAPISSGASDNLTEFRLRRTFARVLHIEGIGADDDFFESGGHSLAAVRLMAAIEQDFGVRLPVAMLFQASTVRRLAALIESDDIPRVNVIPAQPEGGRPSLVSLSSGTVMRGLIMRQAPEQPVLVAQRPADLCLDDRFEDIAAKYVRDLRQSRLPGPYYLTGWCMAGVYAFEVARQLERAGETVGLVILLDVMCPEMLQRQTILESAVMRVKKTAYDFRRAMQLAPGQARHYATERLQTLQKNLRQTIWRMKTASLNGSTPVDVWEDGENAMNVAGRRYTAGTIHAPVLLIQSSDGFIAERGDPTWGWGRHASQLEIVRVPGNHESMFRGPHVAALAEVVKDRLRKAQEVQAGQELHLQGA